jgi:hypothetical protein
VIEMLDKNYRTYQAMNVSSSSSSSSSSSNDMQTGNVTKVTKEMVLGVLEGELSRYMYAGARYGMGIYVYVSPTHTHTADLGYLDKRSAKLEQDDFLVLLNAFNDRGFHFRS